MLLHITPILIAFFLNAISSLYVRKRAENMLIYPYYPLPDLIHSTFNQSNTLSPDLFMLLSIIGADHIFQPYIQKVYISYRHL